MKHLNRITFLILFILFAIPSYSQVPPFSKTLSFSASGIQPTGVGFAVGGLSLNYYAVQWVWKGQTLPSACTATLETSGDGNNWATAAITGDCSTDGISTATQLSANYIRVNISTLTPASSGTLTITITGWASNPNANNTFTGAISGNTAASATGAAVPTDAGYTGVSDSGLKGVTGTVVGGKESMNVDVLAAVLPSGASTSANQATVITLLNGGLPAALGTGGGIKIDGSGTAIPVSSTTLATAANQTTANSSLSNIDSATSRLTSSAGAVGGASTLATTALLAGGEYHSTPLTLTDTKQAELQLDNHGLLLVSCTGCSSSGAITSWGGGTLGAMANYGTSPGAVLVPGVNANVTNLTVDSADNAAFTEAPVGIGGIYSATPADHTDGDKATIVTDIKGRVIVVNPTAANFNATIVGTGTFATQSAITAASGAMASGSYASGAFASGAFASGSITDGANVTLGAKADAADSHTDTTAINAMQVLKEISKVTQAVIGDPCNGAAKAVFPVNIATATTTVIHAAVASNFFYICGVNLVAAGAQTIAIIDGTGGTCGSGTPTGLNGGATAATGWSFAANGGIALGSGNGTVTKTSATNRDVCLITGQSAQISGTVTYVTAP